MPIEEKRKLIIESNSRLSISKQCKIVGLSRSTFYYQGKEENSLNLELMRLMDQHYLDHPYKGARRMYIWLTRDKGYEVSRNRIDRLYYKIMGLRAICPGPHTSKPNKAHKVYPYLLRDLKIEKPNQVWAVDITYIAMEKGYMYLFAIIDLYSRFVVGWSVSNTMEAGWCLQVVQEAVKQYGPPEILNTDQGSQFTSDCFSNYIVKQLEVKLSMDGKGRATDNAFIERLWRSVKYEKLYLSPPENGIDLHQKLSDFFQYYNFERRHQGIEDYKPSDWYFNQVKAKAA